MTGHTVLVLGAGASFAYGLPLGTSLVKSICELLPSSATNRLHGNSEILHSQLDGMPEVRAWAQKKGTQLIFATLAFRQRLIESDPISIDEFLSRDFGDMSLIFRSIGKLAIAHVIAQAENETSFDNSIDPEKDWYRYFWQNCLNSNVQNLNQLKTKRLQIVSFNYDRSLEYFLGRRIAACYQTKPDQILEPSKAHIWAKEGFEFVSQHLQITHPYGVLGSLEDAAYGMRNNARDHGLEMAKRIRVIGEERIGLNTTDSFELARDWVDAASTVIFVGFSFDSTNMARLGLEHGLNQQIKSDVTFGTKRLFPLTYGFEMAERNQLREKYFGKFFSNSYSATEGDHVAMSPRHYAMSITKYLRTTGALFEV